MSLAMQVTTDVNAQIIPPKGPDGRASADSDEFANVIDGVSSDNREQNAHCDNGCADKHGTEAKSGTSGQADGKDLPPDANAEQNADKSSDKSADENSDKIDVEVFSESSSGSPSLRNQGEDQTNLIDQIFNSETTPKDLPHADGSQPRPVLTAEGQGVGGEGVIEEGLIEGQILADQRLATAENAGAVKGESGELDQSSNLLNQGSQTTRIPTPGELAASPLPAQTVAANQPSAKEVAAAVSAVPSNAKLISESTGSQDQINPVLSENTGKDNEFEGQRFQPNIADTSNSRSKLMLNPEQSKAVDVDAMVKELIPGGAKEGTLTSPTATNQIGASVTPSNTLAQTGSGLSTSGLGLTASNQLLTLGTNVTDPAWADDFSVRIRTLVSGNVQQATLNLRPAELGSIEVKLATEGNETKAQFVVQNAIVKEAMEASMPRLREIFEESGLSLSDTDVRDQSLSQQAGEQNAGEKSDGFSRDGNSQQDSSGRESQDGLNRGSEHSVIGAVDYYI